ncbi:MAG: gluconate 2-dehydrogenase subunit 3 family protein [Terricaulis sp.]
MSDHLGPPAPSPATILAGEGAGGPANLSRRTTLKWVIAAAATPLLASACGDRSGWRDVRLSPIGAEGYGTDPNLMAPSAPWPLTMTEAQRTLTRTAADIIVPGAAALNVDAFVDEWISAPYERQQNDRALILSGLAWIGNESQSRYHKMFMGAPIEEQRAIFDDIAYKDRIKSGHDRPAEFFARLRALVLAAYYTSPQGVSELGYMGNSPMVGAYPGPTGEAITHLRGKLDELGLDMPDLRSWR